MDTLPVGTTLMADTYVVTEVLGRGGFGITYKATDEKLSRAVAIKEFFPQGCHRKGELVESGSTPNARFADGRAKFCMEGKTLATLRHPNIVTIHSLFEQNDTAYLVMEFVEGVTLQSLVDKKGALSESQGLDYIKQIGSALEAVHKVNLVHRDIKPENIMVQPDGRAVLLDFGLIRKEEDATIYGTRHLSGTTSFGTDGYAPLEQYGRTGVFGAHTDVYALGATFYHLLTGEVPMSAPDRAQGAPFLSPQQLKPQISRASSEAIMWAMSLKAPERPQSVENFLNKFQAPATSGVNLAASVDLTGMKRSLDIAKTITDSNSKAETLWVIVQQAVRGQEYKFAIDVALEDDTTGGTKDWALANVVEEAMKNDQVEIALKAAEAMFYPANTGKAKKFIIQKTVRPNASAYLTPLFENPYTRRRLIY